MSVFWEIQLRRRVGRKEGGKENEAGREAGSNAFLPPRHVLLLAAQSICASVAWAGVSVAGGTPNESVYYVTVFPYG